MNRFGLCAVTTLLTLAGCTSAGGGSPSGGESAASDTTAGLERAIVFSRFLPGEDHGVLYRIDAGGTQEREIREVSEDCAVLSPDGARFAIAAVAPDGRLTTATFGPDGTGYVLLTLPDPTLQVGCGAWSPDGTRFASDGWDETDPTRVGIYARDTSDGDGLLRLTNAGSRADFPIAYSPDGSRFLFFRPHAQGETGDGEPLDLLVVNAGGGGVRRLTPPGKTTAMFLGGNAASWSPDGNRVAVVAAPGHFWDSTSRSVYVVEADGSGAQRIGPRGLVVDTAWSPDGQWIAFTIGDPADLYLMHPDGSGVVALTSATDGSFSFGPKWSPDSKQLLFVRGSDDVHLTDLWSVDVDGSDLFQVTDTPSGYTSYAFAPSTG